MDTSDFSVSALSARFPAYRLRRSVLARMRRLWSHENFCRENDIPFDEGAFDSWLAFLRLWSRRLDNISLLRHPPRECSRVLRETSSREMLEAVFGFQLDAARRSSIEDAMLENLKLNGLEGRRSELTVRIELEVYEKLYRGWFLVFNMLSVADDHYDAVTFRGSEAFAQYIRKITRDVGAAVYGSKKAYERAHVPSTSLHTYVCVRERGDETGRFHLHVLHFLRALPKDAVDPNLRRLTPNYREINSFRKYWPHGFSGAKAVRSSGMDAFSRIGWIWPVEKIDGKWEPLRALVPRKLGQYLSKYTLKAYYEKEIGEDLWKTKTSRKFGLTAVTQAVKAMSGRDLETVLKMDALQFPSLNGKTLPVKQIKEMATEKLILKHLRSGLSESEANSLIKAVPSGLPMLERVRSWLTADVGNMTAACGSMNNTSTSIQTLPRADISRVHAIFGAVFQEYGINELVRVGSTRTRVDDAL